MRNRARCLSAITLALTSAAQPVPDHVDITWMSITNMYYEVGPLRILTDGYVTRIPENEFFGGGSGVAHTHHALLPDTAAVRRVLAVLGGPRSVGLLLTGHSHFDHSFDTPTWSHLTGARIVGSRSTCLQAAASDLPSNRCTVVEGGEVMHLATGVTMYVIRWNHGGDHARNPEQHDPVELSRPPVRDPETGGFHAGVAEDFPNGGGSRAYLFVVDAPGGSFSWLYTNTGSAVDLATPIVVDGVSYGAPLDNLRAALARAGVSGVDLWIGAAGAPLAELVLPVLEPRAFLPIHWDGLFGAFEAGVAQPYADSALARLLEEQHVKLVVPRQYMDKWRLDRGGIRSVPNADIKKALGFLPS